MIKSGVAGYEKQLEASRSGVKPLYRPRGWRKEERKRKKMVRKVAWYRPADCVGFYPPTPGGELARSVGKVLQEEGERIGLDLRCVETGGVSLAKQLVKANLRSGEPCGRPGCVLDEVSGGAGGPHNVPSVLYKGTCNLCEEVGENAEYWGETGRSACHRCLQHQEEVVKRSEVNAFANHLALHHPQAQGDITNFKIQVVSAFKKPFPREKTEAVKIGSSEVNQLMNSKAEHRQPAIHRVQMTRELGELQPARGRERERGGRSRRVVRGV